MTTLRIQMRRAAAVAMLAAAGATAGVACAQFVVPTQPTVTVSASATVTVSNDRLQAWLRAEAENPNPAAAASQVNALIAKALATARSYPAVKVATTGYSTQQVTERGKPSRWHVAQSISLDSADFTAAATLITRLQEENGLLLSGMGFSLSDKVRRDAEDGVTQQAIRSWQSRAEQAAHALGFAGWRPGHLAVQTGDGGRMYPTMRAQATPGFAPAPIAVEAGTTDVTVTVSGEAVLEAAAIPSR
ncbi:MAG TPA: SIMPL domain-containing protein [Casimicrobiaceae bacterium]|nr:SIMPL domain-containing protein [Casimicrobiaceae bacterium]